MRVHRDRRSIFADTRNAPGIDGQQKPYARESENESEDATGNRDHQALGEQLTNDVPASGAERRARSKFPLARGGANQQQIRNVGAGNQEHQTDGAKQYVKGRTSIADHQLLPQDHAEATVRSQRAGVCGAILVGGQLQLSVGHGHGDAGLQARDHAEVVGLVRRSELKLKGQPEISGIIRNELAADYAYDLIRLSVELNISADDRAICAESPVPQTVTQYHHVSAMGAIFRGGKSPARDHGRAQNRKIIRADMHALHLLGPIVAGEVQSGAAAVVRRNLVKDSCLLPPDVELGHVRARERTLIAGVHQMDKRLGVGIREGLEQNCIDDGEDGRIRADPDGNHKNGDHRECWGFQQRAHGEANVVPDVFEGKKRRSASDAPAILEPVLIHAAPFLVREMRRVAQPWHRV